MALIHCPECGGQVSDRAPTCPHCGVPIAAAPSANATPQAEERSAPSEELNAAPQSAGSSAELTPHETVEPFKFRIGGRPIPIAGLLFWGGMVFGVILKYGLPPAPDAEPELWRRLPWAMIWIGVLWFAVTEFTALMMQRRRKR